MRGVIGAVLVRLGVLILAVDPKSPKHTS